MEVTGRAPTLGAVAGRPAGGRIGAAAAFGVVMGRRSAGCTRGYAGGGTGRCAARRAAWPSLGARLRALGGDGACLRDPPPLTFSDVSRLRHSGLSICICQRLRQHRSLGGFPVEPSAGYVVCMGMALPLPGDTQTQSQPDPSPTPLSPFWDPPSALSSPPGTFLTVQESYFGCCECLFPV